MEQSVKQRITSFIEYKNISIREFERVCGLSNGYYKSLRHAPSSEKLSAILRTFPELNRTWLLTGEGEMLNSDSPLGVAQPENCGIGIPFYERAIMCGSPADFDACIKASQSDGQIMLPRLSGDFALVARGDSMIDTEHPDRSIMPGAIVVLRKVSDRSLLQWGEIYAIATADGFIIKKIMPLDDERIECRSLNAAEFPPFPVPKSDIFGFARVIAVISYKLY